MPKPKRGKLTRAVKGWRGTCPICSRTGVKILWEKVDGEKTLKVCKQCGSQLNWVSRYSSIGRAADL